jgi:hypothetical protein
MLIIELNKNELYANREEILLYKSGKRSIAFVLLSLKSE